MNIVKRQKDMTMEDELPTSIGVKYSTGEGRWNSSRRNEEAEQKQNNAQLWDVSGDESKVQCCKNNIA